MKALVIGCGSIGLRHLKNLRTLDVEQLAVVDPHQDRLDIAKSEAGAKAFFSIGDALEWSPDIAVVATPSNAHTGVATLAAQANAHLFIEKPLAASLAGLDELIHTAQERSLLTMVGCNMRFHPGPKAVREIVESGVLGKVLFGRLESGSYLPKWRPNRDFRQTYSSSREAGGGCILDCIHEIDLARWLLGEFSTVSCITNNFSSLGIEVEEIAAITARHENGALSEIHLDYVQRSYERGIKIVGTLGTVIWDHRRAQIEHYDADSEAWSIRKYPASWEMNDMYVDEMRYFLNCVESGSTTFFSLEEALAVLKPALAMRDSPILNS